MKNVKVSIIVPVYNGQKWLHRCLRSLVNQTLKEIQIVCIDDCSTDGSLVILREYARKDKRILVKKLKKNGGESVARNKGLDIAKGKYIAFVDQDDYVDLNFYEKLYENTKNGSVDVVKGESNMKKHGKNNMRNRVNYAIAKNRFYFVNHWWTAIYNASFLRNNNIRLDEDLVLGGDTVFLVKAVVNANKVNVVDGVSYNYVKRTTSGDAKIFNYKKINSVFLTFSRVLDYLDGKAVNEKNYGIIYKELFLYFLSCINRCRAAKNKIFGCNSAIKLYEMCKYKRIFEEIGLPTHFFSDNNSINELLKWLTRTPDASYPIVKINSQRKNIYIWGKGNDAESVIWQCKENNWKITGFIDLNEKTGAISPAEILTKKNKNYFIIISSRSYWPEIVSTCEKAGLKKGIDFWSPK